MFIPGNILHYGILQSSLASIICSSQFHHNHHYVCSSKNLSQRHVIEDALSYQWRKEDISSLPLPTLPHKLTVTPDPQVLHSWMLHTCSKRDPPPCSEGFHRTRRVTVCRYVATIPLAILLPNVCLLSQAPGFIPCKPIRAQQGLKKKEGKWVRAEKKRDRMQDRTRVIG